MLGHVSFAHVDSAHLGTLDALFCRAFSDPLASCCPLALLPFGFAAMQIADIWSCGVMLYVMLVGAYPFERPEDKHDTQKLQKMIQVGTATYIWGSVGQSQSMLLLERLQWLPCNFLGLLHGLAALAL